MRRSRPLIALLSLVAATVALAAGPDVHVLMISVDGMMPASVYLAGTRAHPGDQGTGCRGRIGAGSDQCPSLGDLSRAHHTRDRCQPGGPRHLEQRDVRSGGSLGQCEQLVCECHPGSDAPRRRSFERIEDRRGDVACNCRYGHRFPRPRILANQLWERSSGEPHVPEGGIDAAPARRHRNRPAPAAAGASDGCRPARYGEVHTRHVSAESDARALCRARYYAAQHRPRVA